MEYSAEYASFKLFMLIYDLVIDGLKSRVLTAHAALMSPCHNAQQINALSRDEKRYSCVQMTPSSHIGH